MAGIESKKRHTKIFISTLFVAIKFWTEHKFSATVKWVNCCVFTSRKGDYCNENEHITTAGKIAIYSINMSERI
jgi:hypothetical protein